MSLVSVLRLCTQFFAIPILARILSPADYGIVGMAVPIMGLAMMIADAGVGMSLVRSPASQSSEWSTCFWLSVILGVCLAGAMCIAAPVASALLDEPRLTPIVVALALVVVAQAIVIIPTTMLQRNNRFRLIAAIEASATVIGAGVAVVVALEGGGAWALVGQQLAFSAVKLGATWSLSPFRPRWTLDFSTAREHLTFSRDIITINLVVFFTRQVDSLVIGPVLGLAAVGIYSMTWQFVRLPLMVVTGPLQYVLYAQLAPIKEDVVAVRRLFLVLTRCLATITFPTLGMIAVAHEAVFNVLLSQKWQGAGEIFQLIAPVGAFQAVTAIGGTVMLVFGRTDIQLRTTVEFGVCWIIAMFISVSFGLNCLAAAYSIATLMYAPRLLILTLRPMGCNLSSYVQVIMAPALATVGCVVCFVIVSRLFAPNDFLQLLWGGGLAILCIGTTAATQRRLVIDEIAIWRNAVALHASIGSPSQIRGKADHSALQSG